MPEVQEHGFTFEKWVREELFAGYSGEYAQKWDIPAESNQHNVLPDEIENLPISVKTVKYGSPIGLGDAIRQRSINEPFLIIVGFWKQRTPEEKWIEEIACVRFTPEVWNKMWGPISIEELKKFDAMVKNFDIPYQEAREKAQEWKKNMETKGKSTLVINPKIGSGKQRRVQCSIPFKAFWQVAGREPKSADHPSIFGVKFKNPIHSGKRVFNKDDDDKDKKEDE